MNKILGEFEFASCVSDSCALEFGKLLQREKKDDRSGKNVIELSIKGGYFRGFSDFNRNQWIPYNSENTSQDDYLLSDKVRFYNISIGISYLIQLI